MWVDPGARAAGAGRRLLNELEGMRSVGGKTSRLSDTTEAHAARALYESAGYEPDGRVTPSRHTEGLVEVGLRKQLS